MLNSLVFWTESFHPNTYLQGWEIETLLWIKFLNLASWNCISRDWGHNEETAVVESCHLISCQHVCICRRWYSLQFQMTLTCVSIRGGIKWVWFPSNSGHWSPYWCKYWPCVDTTASFFWSGVNIPNCHSCLIWHSIAIQGECMMSCLASRVSPNRPDGWSTDPNNGALSFSAQVDPADLLKHVEARFEQCERDADPQTFAKNRKSHYDMRDALKRWLHCKKKGKERPLQNLSWLHSCCVELCLWQWASRNTWQQKAVAGIREGPCLGDMPPQSTW